VLQVLKAQQGRRVKREIKVTGAILERLAQLERQVQQVRKVFKV
jgi:hypothetical protein